MADRRVQLVLEAHDRASRVIDDVGDSLKGIEIDLKKVGLAAAGIVGALTGAAVVATKAAIDGEVPWAKLDTQLQNAGYNSKALRGEIEAMGRSLQDVTRYADGDTVQVLGTLVGITQDYGASLRNIELVYDLATAREMDFTSAAQIVGRVMEGNNQILSRFGIVVEEGADGIAVLRERFGGLARQDAQTLAGSIKQVRNEIGSLIEGVGQAILKSDDFAAMVAKVREEIKRATEWVAENEDKIAEWVGQVRDAIVWVIDLAKATAEWAKEHKDLLIVLGTTAAMVQVTVALVELGDALSDAIRGAKIFMALELSTPLLRLIPHVKSAADVTTLLAWSFEGLGAALVAGGPVLVGLGLVGAALYGNYKETKQAREELQQYREDLREFSIEQVRAEYTQLLLSRAALDEQRKAAEEAALLAAETESRNRRDMPTHEWRTASELVTDLTNQVSDLDKKIIEAGIHLSQLLQAEAPSEVASGPAAPRRGIPDPSMSGVGSSLVPAAFEFKLPANHDAIIRQFQLMREEERKTIEATLEFQRVIEHAVGTALVQSFVSFGQALADSFSDIDGAFKGLLGSVSSVLGDIMIAAGTQIVLTSKAFAAFKASLQTLLPGGGIGAGLGLIAAGAAFKAATSSFLSSPTGGGGGAAGGSMGSYADTIGAGRGGDGGPVTLVIEGGLLDMSDPRQEQALAEAMQRLSGRRVIVEYS